MTLRIAKKSSFAIAAGLTLGLVGTAAAQVRPDQTIRITKDAPGEIARIDTVRVFRTDTVRVFRTDTVRVEGQTQTVTVTRYDTVTVEMLPGWVRRPSGMYFGLGAGPMYPGGALFPAQSNGYNFQAHLGADPTGSPIGWRLDANWARPNEENNYAEFGGRSDVINLGADLKLRLPWMSVQFPLSLYAVGGGNYIRYKGVHIQLDEQTAGTVGDNVARADGQWHDKFGWNYGGGLAFGWGKHEVFLESRVISFKPENARMGHQFPIVLGLNWY